MAKLIRWARGSLKEESYSFTYGYLVLFTLSKNRYKPIYLFFKHELKLAIVCALAHS